jgi:low temperature requirement protein LtrA
MTDAPAMIPEPVELEPADAGWREERRTGPVELLWDLVFVFAVTQVTTLLSSTLNWAGFGRAMLVLALVWWAWSAFVWAANAAEPDSWVLRLSLLFGTVFIFIAGLALPRAFRSEGTLFAVSYAAVRFLHLALYSDASRRGNASWSSIAGFAVTVAIGMALLIVGSIPGGTAKIVLWAVAVAIDYAGPAWLTRERLRGLQRVAVAHFVERYSLFVIICLGESIVAVGVGARSGGRALTPALVSAVSLGLLITVGMWWTYFDRFAAIAQERLRNHSDPVLAAADGYSYLHLVIVAGIITFAVGARLLAQGAVDVAFPPPARLALCGGVALYLLGNVAFRLRMVGTPGYHKLAIVVGLALLYALGNGLPAWSIAAGATALLAALCAAETLAAPD